MGSLTQGEFKERGRQFTEHLLGTSVSHCMLLTNSQAQRSFPHLKMEENKG